MLYTHPRPFKIFGREAKMLWDGTAAEVQQTTGNISQKKKKNKKERYEGGFRHRISQQPRDLTTR